MFRRTLVGALLCALLAPAAATAGPPVTIGEGASPHLLTEPGNGTAHLVWVTPGEQSITYCQVPRGASACAVTRTLAKPPGKSSVDQAWLIRLAPNVLQIHMPHYGSGETWSWGSSNNGDTWTPATQYYGKVVEFLNPAAEPVPGPNAGETVFGSAGRVVWSSVGPDAAATARAQLPGSGSADFALARIDGTTQMLAASNDGATTSFWRTNGGSPRVTANWTGPTAIPGELDTTRLAHGPAGVYLLGSAGSVSDPRQELRRWNTGTNTFDPPVVLANEIGYINDVTAGPSGAVAAIWRRNEPFGGNRLQLALSGSGAAPYAVTTIAREDVVMSDMTVSLASDNGGWASYEGEGGGATSRIRLADLTTVPDPPPAPPAAGPPAGSGTPDPPKPPVVAPPRPLTVTKTVTVRGATLSVGLPRGCIPAGRPFVATLKWKKQRRRGNLFVKVRRTDFYVGAKRLKIDRKAPFRQTLRIPSPQRGKTYTFRARAFIKMRRGPSPTKSIRATLKVCS